MSENYGLSSVSVTNDALLVNDDCVTENVTIKKVGALVRGTVLGKVTATGDYAPYSATASDGSQNPTAILANDIDTTAEPLPSTVYIAGQFRENGLTGYSATIKDALRGLNIYVKASLAV